MSRLARLPLLLTFILFLAASAAAIPERHWQVESTRERPAYGFHAFWEALSAGEFQGVDLVDVQKANVAFTESPNPLLLAVGYSDHFDSQHLIPLGWEPENPMSVGTAVAKLKAAGLDISDDIIDAAAAYDIRLRRTPNTTTSAVVGDLTGKDLSGVESSSKKGDKVEDDVKTIRFVSSLNAGSIASLLEVLAIFLALLIAANLQAIRSWTARRRLYSRGTASLRDSTWNVGIVDGISKSCLLLDFRAFLAFLFTLCILILEVLTVLQTQPGDSCSFDDSSTWKIEKSAQQCFSNATALLQLKLNEIGIGNEYYNGNSLFSYLAKAETMMEGVDLEQGIPVNTDVFENSIISGKAVQQLRDGNYGEQYTAPVVEASDIFGSVVTTNGVNFSSLLVGKTGESFGYIGTNCSDLGNISYGGWSAYSPIDQEIHDKKENNRSQQLSVAKPSSTGFLRISTCKNALLAHACVYVEGRIAFEEEASVRLDYGYQERDNRYPIQCKFYNISREGRRTDFYAIASAIVGRKHIDTDSIRRALLTTLIAENSARGVPCKRYLAAPKQCTEIGRISVCAISILMMLFVGSLLFRLALSLASRDVANYNGSPIRWALTMFDHFGSSESKSPHTRSKSQRKCMKFLRLYENEMPLSVAKIFNEPYSYRLVLTREPVIDPATYIPGSAIAPLSSATAEEDTDATEVSLV